MEDVVLNGYMQAVLAGIGTALTATVTALFFWVKDLISQKDALQKDFRDYQERNAVKGFETQIQTNTALTGLGTGLQLLRETILSNLNGTKG